MFYFNVIVVLFGEGHGARTTMGESGKEICYEKHITQSEVLVTVHCIRGCSNGVRYAESDGPRSELQSEYLHHLLCTWLRQ